MGFLNRKRKRESDTVARATEFLEHAIKDWRDENGLGNSIRMGRVVGEDWVNFDIDGLETVNSRYSFFWNFF